MNTAGSPTRRGPRTATGAAALLVVAVAYLPMASPAGASSTALAPVSLTTTKGVTGGQPVANLAVRDQSGTTTDPDKVVTFGPGAYKGYRSYYLPGGIDPATIWGVTVEVNYRGPSKTTQRYTWKLYDWTRRAWTTLGDNKGVPNFGAWTVLTFYAGGTLADYVSATTREIRVRLVSAAKPYAADLDDESVLVEYGALPVHPGWKPAVGSRFQYQLQGTIDTTICAVPYSGGACVRPEVFDIDLYGSDGVTPNTAAVAAIHSDGRHAVCYVSGGSWEDWRPDAALFPDSVKGHSNGWPGERWLDVRQVEILLPIMEARVGRCADAGFDGVEFDNVDGYSNSTGFPITASQQITYNRALADLVHAHGLSVALKNDVGQLVQLRPWFDYAMNEQCQQYSECGGYDAWTASGRAVFQVEYSVAFSNFCPPAEAGGRSAIKKSLDLFATPWTPCR